MIAEHDYTIHFMEKLASQCTNCKSTIHSLYGDGGDMYVGHFQSKFKIVCMLF